MSGGMGITMDNIEYNEKDYFSKLVDKIFKLLPIYEGKQRKKPLEIINPSNAYLNYKKEIFLLTVQLNGDYQLYQDQRILPIIGSLKGMEQIEVGHHNEVKICVFNLINSIKFIIDGK